MVWKTLWGQGRGSWSICCPLTLAQPCRGNLAHPGSALVRATIFNSTIAGVICGWSIFSADEVYSGLLSSDPPPNFAIAGPVSPLTLTMCWSGTVLPSASAPESPGPPTQWSSSSHVSSPSLATCLAHLQGPGTCSHPLHKPLEVKESPDEVK